MTRAARPHRAALRLRWATSVRAITLAASGTLLAVPTAAQVPTASPAPTIVAPGTCPGASPAVIGSPIPAATPPAMELSAESADADPCPGPAMAIVVEARDLAFDADRIEASSSGPTTIVLRNAGRVVHNLTVDGLGIQVIASPGGAGEGTITDPPPGTYEFYCSVSGHKQAGMVGTLVVR